MCLLGTVSWATPFGNHIRVLCTILSQGLGYDTWGFQVQEYITIVILPTHMQTARRNNQMNKACCTAALDFATDSRVTAAWPNNCVHATAYFAQNIEVGKRSSLLDQQFQLQRLCVQ